MVKKTPDSVLFRDLVALHESPAIKQIGELQKSQFAMITRANEMRNFLSQINKAAKSINLLANSQQWADVSEKLSAYSRAGVDPAILNATRRWNKEVRLLTQFPRNAILPDAKLLAEFTERAALNISPFKGHIERIENWHASLNARMSAMREPWAISDKLALSVVGFTRIARLHHVAAGATPFSEEAGEIIDEDLGTPVPFEVCSDRDDASVEAGLNPELIAFPNEAYSAVLASAGFDFELTVLEPITPESGDSTVQLDPVYNLVLTYVENTLRQFIERNLRRFFGENWIDECVPGDMRKRWRERREKDCDDRRDPFDLIYYSDFMDLAHIVIIKANWNTVFQQHFSSKKHFEVSMERLHPIRKALSHSRPLAMVDRLYLRAEATRLLNAIGANAILT
ncbi:Swt1 family HEPN domain-containing protein [Roseibium sp. SCP14]|uniref:Swt1 family HEPN domain-containing protein n=1 Tax=Roseibium sp. SCP14 TaxID=3141375 RepID=UPI003336834B